MLCGAAIHSVQIHLKRDHPEVTIEQYSEKFPEAPLLSEFAQRNLKAIREKEKASEGATIAAATAPAGLVSLTKEPLHEVFKLGKVKAALSPKGDPIPITVLSRGPDADMIPNVNDAYVFEIEDLKNSILAMELGMPLYVWGMHGSGKTELIEQIGARTNRPVMRVQHSANTEESHIVGQWTVKNGSTVWENGPLPLAMIHGWLYLADEYDFANAAVLAVYQAVLEGKSLVIKEADAANRVIKPHPNFRFVATGNTNGSGDETGLYQGTNIQNSANYDRFGVTINKRYMSAAQEMLILQNTVGLVKEDAEKMVKFGNLVRDAYAASQISSTISPRSLINAAKLGVKRASFRIGVTLAFINKLNRIDKETVDGIAQRIFS
jgi:cobaltochelatase CobS